MDVIFSSPEGSSLVPCESCLRGSPEAEAFVKSAGRRYISAELHRLRGVFLAALGANDTQIESSFCEAIKIANEQKSISLEKRAQAT